MTRRAPALALCVSLLACSSSKEQAPAAGGAHKPVDRGADRADIAKARKAYQENHSAGDSRRIGAMYTADAVLMTSDQQPVVGQQAIIDSMQATYDRYSVDIALSSDEVLFLADDWAFDRGTYKVTVKPKDGSAGSDAAGSYVVLWQRQPDGSWKLARDIDNSWAPAAD